MNESSHSIVCFRPLTLLLSVFTLYCIVDKTYRAVQAANEVQPDGYKYHIVGGAAATVSPSKF